MNELRIFENNAFGKVRVQVVNEMPMFCLADVASCLGYSNPAKAVIDHCKGVTILETPTYNQYGAEVIQNIKFGKEADVYRLVMKSKMPDAENFQDWVCEDVLPSIRKHGAYMTKETIEQVLTSPEFLIQLATNLKEEKDKRIAAEQRIEEQKPKVLFAESVSGSSGLISIRLLAKLIKQNGIDMGQTRLFKWMRDNGYLVKQKGVDYNTPTQKSMRQHLLEVKEGVLKYKGINGGLVHTVKVTGAGQVYFLNKFLGMRSLFDEPQSR